MNPYIMFKGGNALKIMFMGTPPFAAEILESLIQSKHEVIAVVTQPDRPKGRKRILTPSPVKLIAEKHQLPIYQPENIRNKDQHAVLLNIDMDMIVTAAYGQFVPKSLLNKPHRMAINVHASLLPKYRGGAPIHYAIWKGEKETGISIIEMISKMDAGDILIQQSLPIEKSDNVGSMFEKLAKLGKTTLLEALDLIENNRHTSTPQIESQATYSPNITKEQEQIDWFQSASEIDNHIRAFCPFPTTYTILNQQRVKIWKGQVIENDFDFSGQPGQIMDIKNNLLLVQTGNEGLYGIEIWQESGKKQMTIEQALKGKVINQLIGQHFESRKQAESE